MYEVTVSRIFAAAHAIRLYDGSLEPVHGHNWAIEVTVGADQLDEIDVVMDFHQLEMALDQLIAQVQNRSFNDIPPFAGLTRGAVGVNPTAERVARWIADQIAPELANGVHLSQVKVGEAPGCTASFRPSITP